MAQCRGFSQIQLGELVSIEVACFEIKAPTLPLREQPVPAKAGIEICERDRFQ
jgi:hypothetical protein